MLWTEFHLMFLSFWHQIVTDNACLAFCKIFISWVPIYSLTTWSQVTTLRASSPVFKVTWPQNDQSLIKVKLSHTSLSGKSSQTIPLTDLWIVTINCFTSINMSQIQTLCMPNTGHLFPTMTKRPTFWYPCVLSLRSATSPSTRILWQQKYHRTVGNRLFKYTKTPKKCDSITHGLSG